MNLFSNFLLFAAEAGNTAGNTELGAWPTIWKACLIIAFIAFAIMAVLVSILGAKDIFALFAHLQNKEKP